VLAVLHRAPYLSQKSSDSWPGHRLHQKFRVSDECSNQWLRVAYPASVTADSFEEWRASTHRANTDLSQLATQLQFGFGNAGVSQEIRMKLTGRVNPEMNKGYTHHQLEPLRAAVRAIP
jgi:hypothetical protein